MSDLTPTHESVQNISQRQRKLRDEAIENQLSSLTECASMLKLKVMDIMQDYASIRSLPTHILSELGAYASSVIEFCQDFICERNEDGGTDDRETCQEELAGVERQFRGTLVLLERLVQGWDDMDVESVENEEELIQDVMK
ncbi:hypothetical protein L210DRAFT_3512150 [Boletus edulis BED1]|uniref:Uncharacterized protein n=1 Tax=Boletus edulis BED1 TaxID=1328754 RepID=A0AAD4BAW2_BOLED|nr:hypothetical protein L210DRAFT_3512150 [Boletus edulis BED1]